jgi:RHS repeat-associated protein
MASRTDASGTTSYGYDAAGRLSALTDGSTGTTLSYGYNSDSQVTSIQYGSGGATQTFSYNTLHELTGDTLTSPSGQTEASVSYGYDLNGNETSKTTTGVDGASANTYTYDEANRLTSWNNGTTTVAYGYDADGNRTQAGSQTYTYNARDEPTSAGGATYSYTARGTLASVTSAAGAAVTSTSDAFNQVITDGSQTYTYDALGRDLNASGHTLSYSGMSNDVASDGTATYSRDPSGGIVGITSGGGSVLALTDQHRDVVGEFTASGSSLSGSVTYDPFGNVTAGTGMAGRLGYQSGWTDPATGKVNMGSRWYSPGTGQFTSRDSASNSPVPNSVTANTFAYGDDNPLTAYDPLGTCGLFDFGCYARSVSHAVSSAARAVSSAWNNFTSWAGAQVQRAASWVYNQAAQAVTNLVSYANHVVSTAVNYVQDGWQWTQNAVNSVQQTITHNYQNVAHWVYDGGKAVLTTGVHIVYQAAQAVKYAAQNTGQFIVDHRAAIASFAASTPAIAGCDCSRFSVTVSAIRR